MKKLQFIIQIIVLSLLFAISVVGNKVLLDTTYNGTGYSINPVAPAPFVTFARSFALQPDGKAVIGGSISNDQTQTGSFVLMRLSADGTLDTSFGNGGVTIITIERLDREGFILIQPDGKYLLAGTSASNATGFNFTVVRFTTDGQLDTTFNKIGYANPTINGDSFEECYGAALQPDGKIVLVGRAAQFPNLQYDIAVMRFNTDGSLDTTFNGTGILKIGFPSSDEEAYSVVVQPDGKIIVGGSQKISKYNYLIARLNTDGTFDTSFGNGGMTITQADVSANIVTAAALQSNGKILAAGRGHVARYNTNGVLDTSFGIGGLTPADSVVNQVLVLNDDKFIVVYRNGVQRYLESGGIDTKFRNFTNYPDVTCNPVSGAIVGDDKLIFGGRCSTRNDPIISGFAAFRLQEIKTKRFLDFDGNEIAELSLYRPSTGQWIISGSNTNIQFGTSTDKLVPADFTGDGRTDIAVYRPSSGEWLILRSENGTFYSFPFGLSEDIPVAADYDGDQIDDVAVFRPSLNTWFIQKSTGGITYENFGQAGDKLVPSDYDGDFKTDIAIYRPSNGQWWIHRSSDEAIYAFEFGTSEDIPVRGDYTGDNKTDAAFWRPSTGEWFILRSEDFSYYAFPWGLSDDLPAPANFAGDARYDAAVYRPSNNRWYILLGEGNIIQADFGTSGDLPIPNFFVP